MKATLIMLTVVTSIAAAPATRPASRPATRPAAGNQSPLKLRDDAPDQLKQLALTAAKNRPSMLKQAQARLRKANDDLSARKRGRVIAGAADSTMTGKDVPTYIYASTDSKKLSVDEAQSAVRRVQKELEWIRVAPVFFPDSYDHEQRIEAGWIGRAGDAHVVQVIDPAAAGRS